MTLQLGDVQTTALIPVAIKANETLKKNARIKDDVAVEIIRHLEMDTKPFDKFLSHEGVVARTVMLDRMVKDFVAKNPDTVIANLGAGFDNRFSRVDNGRISWFDVDLSDSIAARKKVFDERERVTMIAGSVLEDEWCALVKAEVQKKNAPVLFLAEGLFMYFSMEEIRAFLSIIKSEFPPRNPYCRAEQSTLRQQPKAPRHCKKYERRLQKRHLERSGNRRPVRRNQLCGRAQLQRRDEKALNSRLALRKNPAKDERPLGDVYLVVRNGGIKNDK